MLTSGMEFDLLAVMLCALLVAPAYSYEKALPTIQTHDQTNGGVYPKTRVWGSNEKILLHFRAVRQLSEKQHWSWVICSEKIVVGSAVTYDYDAFGNLIHSTGTTPNNYLFAGEQFDPDLGFYYNRARYLNTSTGRFWTMDTFEGYDDDPPSLHKYLCVEADPVDNVDHCGKCLPAVAGYGDIVQEAIFADFELKTGGFTNTAINDILHKSVPSGGLLPDLIDPYTLSSFGLGQIWEIKSVYSEAAAIAKEAMYLSVLNFYSKGTGMKWIPGWTYVPPPIVSINASPWATIDQPAPGVITYCIVNTTEILSFISAAVSAGLYVAVSGATLTSSLAPGAA